jgi:hypothetical protein
LKEWDLCEKIEMDSSLIVQSEHHVPTTIIKDHKKNLSYLKIIRMVRQNQCMAIKKFEEIQNAHTIVALLASHDRWSYLTTISISNLI